MITPPEDEDLPDNDHAIDLKKVRRGRRASMPFQENTDSKMLLLAHLPKAATVSANPAQSRINSLLGAPAPSRVRRNSIDPSIKLPTGSNVLGLSDLTGARSASRSKLLQSLLSIPGKGGKARDRQEKVVEEHDDNSGLAITKGDKSAADKSDRMAPSPSLRPKRWGRRGSVDTASALIQASLRIANVRTDNLSFVKDSLDQLQTLEEHSGR